MADTHRGAREPMTKVDTAWLRMESPTNLMMITGVLVFSEPLALNKLKRLLEKRFLAFRRFRQKAVDEGNAAYWETQSKFDINHHVRAAKLPGKADKLALCVLTGLP